MYLIVSCPASSTVTFERSRKRSFPPFLSLISVLGLSHFSFFLFSPCLCFPMMGTRVDGWMDGRMVPVAAAPRSILQSGEDAWVRVRGSESFFFPRFPSSVQSMPALSPHEMTTPLSIHPLPHLAQPNSLLPSYIAMPSPPSPFQRLEY